VRSEPIYSPSHSPVDGAHGQAPVMFNASHGAGIHVLPEMQVPSASQGREARLPEMRNRTRVVVRPEAQGYHPQGPEPRDGGHRGRVGHASDRRCGVLVVRAYEGILGPEADQGCGRARDEDIQVREVLPLVARVLVRWMDAQSYLKLRRITGVYGRGVNVPGESQS
jgi:hypothetical protein